MTFDHRYMSRQLIAVFVAYGTALETITIRDPPQCLAFSQSIFLLTKEKSILRCVKLLLSFYQLATNLNAYTKGMNYLPLIWGA